MNRQELFKLAENEYSAVPDHPWQDENAVLRHQTNRKWFGVVLRVKRSRIGLPGEDEIDVLNVKCDPLLSGSYRMKPGIHPAYHMNKERWISILLDGTASEEDIRFLLDASWEMTR